MSNLDLLQAHLSGATTPDDADALDAALANDPALAREFAEAARLEAQLTAHFAPSAVVLPLVTELQDQSSTSSALPPPTKGGQCFQPVLAPPATDARARRGQAGSTDLPSLPAPAHVNGGERLLGANARLGRPWMRAAAAMLVALGLMAATSGWLRHRPDTSSPESDGVQTPEQKPLLRAAQATAFPKPPSLAKQEETPEMRALRRRLEAYYLTDLGLDQAVPLSQALERLLSRARELNHLRQPVIDNLSVASAAGRVAVKASEVPIRLSQSSLSLMDALRLVAAQVECEIRLAPPGTIALKPLPKLASSKLVTRALRVRPDFGSSRAEAATPAGSEKAQIHQNALQLERQTRKEILDYKAQLESIKDKQPDEFIAASAHLGIQDPESSALYTAYLADLAELRQLEQRYGSLHPTLKNHRAKVEMQRAQLGEATEPIRRILETKLSSASSILANMEKITQEARRHALEEFGISFPENTAAVFNPAKALLTVTHTEAALRQIEAFLAVDSNRLATMIHASMKVLEFSEGHALENRLMDSASFAEWLREQNGREGVSLLGTPSITTRSGQNATVEIMGEVAVAPERDGESKPDWQGTRINVYPTLEGEVVRLAGSAEVRRPRDAAPGELLHKTGVSGKGELASTAADIDAIIPLGQTALFSLSEKADGPHLVAAITLQLIDPSGQRIGDGSEERIK